MCLDPGRFRSSTFARPFPSRWCSFLHRFFLFPCFLLLLFGFARIPNREWIPLDFPPPSRERGILLPKPDERDPPPSYRSRDFSLVLVFFFFDRNFRVMGCIRRVNVVFPLENRELALFFFHGFCTCCSHDVREATLLVWRCCRCQAHPIQSRRGQRFSLPLNVFSPARARVNSCVDFAKRSVPPPRTKAAFICSPTFRRLPGLPCLEI